MQNCRHNEFSLSLEVITFSLFYDQWHILVFKGPSTHLAKAIHSKLQETLSFEIMASRQ